jgi:rhodanese-related sulfurtransferase
LGNLEACLSDFNKDENYILVCRSGGRSGKAATIMANLGYENVYNMVGGMIEWNNNNLITSK